MRTKWESPSLLIKPIPMPTPSKLAQVPGSMVTSMKEEKRKLLDEV